MGRLCERPGCSEPGAASYGMVPEDLLFWVDTLHPAESHDTGVLCRRHADAMVVPRGWTLDDRREPQPRLFRPASPASAAVSAGAGRAKRRRSSAPADTARPAVEQLELEPTGTDDLAPPVAPQVPTESAPGADGEPVAPWVPDFDATDDLDGLLHVKSPLLARAFRGTDRAR
ncbi:MAG: DUF3499 family protein [Ilumatobacteraceae bacterium]